MSVDKQKAALKRLAEIKQHIDRLFEEAETVSNEADVDFAFTMRGRDSDGNTYEYRQQNEWEDSGCSYNEEGHDKPRRWVSSSDSC